MTDLDRMILRACKLAEITDIKDINLETDYSTGKKTITIDLGYTEKADKDFAEISSHETISNIWISEDGESVYMWRTKTYDSEVFDIPVTVRKFEYMGIDDFVLTYGCTPEDMIAENNKKKEELRAE